MLLCVDIGNTNITLGIFENKTLIETFRLASKRELSQENYELSLCELLQKYNIKNCIIASVVNELNDTIKSSIDKIFKINSIVVNNNLNLGIKLDVKNPTEVGVDRIANACGAFYLYPKPSIVVDLGSATTFDITDKQGNFIGGVIMPGILLQLNTLHSNTSKLPKIDPMDIKSTIGKNTIDAILSGVIRGSASAVEGLINQCEDELGEKATIIATGGFSTLINKYMRRKFDFVNPNLTLEGLRYLYELNT